MDPGPDSKRARHQYDAPQRTPSAYGPSHPPTPSHIPHGQPGILPAPPTYSQPPPQTHPPPSPFADVNHDGRAMADPHAYVQQHPHSGQTTPRDGRFPSQQEMDYQRRGSAVGTPRSPSGDHSQFSTRPPVGMVTPTETPPYHPQYPVEHGAPPMGYPPQPDQPPHLNGNTMHHGMPMTPHEQAGHPPGPAYPDGYAQSPMATAPPYGLPYGPPLAQQGMRPKKGNRATQACDVCRTRKAKCDEGRPRCGFCVEQDLPCNYQSVAPPKVDRANQAVMDQIEDTKKDVRQLKDDVSKKLDRIEKLVSSLASANHSLFPPLDEAETKPTMPLQSSPPNGQKITISSQMGYTRDTKMLDASPTASFNTTNSDHNVAENLPSVARQNAIQAEHNTAAQKLFRWPSIKALLQKCKGLDFTENSENYVWEMELRKGPLHLYGKGYGPGAGDGNQLAATAASPSNSASDRASDEASDASSPASSSDMLWGHAFNPYVGDSASKESVTGGLCPDNTLKLDPRTIHLLHQSYLQNMHVMHPFLDENGLSRTIEAFKKRYGALGGSDLGKAAFATSASNANVEAVRDSGPYSKPMKRKHSDGQYWSDTGASSQPQATPKPMLERSPATAVVLLVMALGKICECRERLPGPVHVPSREATSFPPRSYSPAAGHRTDSPPPLPLKHSPSSSTLSTVPSPVGLSRTNHMSPRSSVGDITGVHGKEKNLDVIPGLAYYAQATDILGNMTGSHDITYVQCCLLAGLYAGQLANAVESLVWIQSAARGCCILARDTSLSNHPRSRQNSIRLAFYTALQLESDILAELDFPPSGIRRIDGVAYPDGYFAEDTQPPADLPRKSVVMQFYSYQLHLRKLLDWIQQEVYPPGKELADSARNKSMRTIFHGWLEDDWRSMLPPDFNWTDNDHLPRDINHARLRGKYFGALYIIHRPMIHYALELEGKGELDRFMTSIEEQPASPMGPPKTPLGAFQEEVLNSAKIAIQAAIQSTLAFDGAMEMKRLIVTNIFGTAHAQFGNLLVLSAVYKSKHLRGFIGPDPKRKLEHLFKRTINFLGSLKPISATLGHDQFILQCLRDVVFDGEEDLTVESNADFA